MSVFQTPFKGILFDVDGTLYHQAPLRTIMALLLILVNLFRPYELKRKLNVIRQYRKSQEILRESPEMEVGNQNSQLLLTSRHTGESVLYISDVINEWFEKRPLPFLRFCCRRKLNRSMGLLNKKGIKLGVFSDYPAEKKLIALGISEFIKTVVSASDEGVQGFKPKTNGFKIAATKMGLKPSEILYVGDRPEVDGPGGVDAGMQVAIIKSFLRSANTHGYRSLNSLSDLLKVTE